MKWERNFYLQIWASIYLLANKEPHNLIYLNPFVPVPISGQILVPKCILLICIPSTELGRLPKYFTSICNIFWPEENCSLKWRWTSSSLSKYANHCLPKFDFPILSDLWKTTIFQEIFFRKYFAKTMKYEKLNRLNNYPN